jgi:GT2 family glycosyltransferase
VAFLDSDDLWLPNKLAVQLEALDRAIGYRWSYPLFEHVDANGRWIPPHRGGVGAARTGSLVLEMDTEEVLLASPTVLADTEQVRSVGGFDEQPSLRVDLDLCLRLAAAAGACAVDAPLTHIGHHPGRTTFELPGVRAWRVRALDELAMATTDPTVRRACRRESARELVELADALGGSGHARRALAALTEAAKYGRALGSIWRTLVKTLLRPLTPPSLKAAYRSRARRHRGHDVT